MNMTATRIKVKGISFALKLEKELSKICKSNTIEVDHIGDNFDVKLNKIFSLERVLLRITERRVLIDKRLIGK